MIDLKKFEGHTPGPWVFLDDPERIYPDGEIDRGGYRIDGPHIEQIAFVWRENTRWGDGGQVFGSQEAAADATLIAAAPDLLAEIATLQRRVAEYERHIRRLSGCLLVIAGTPSRVGGGSIRTAAFEAASMGASVNDLAFKLDSPVPNDALSVQERPK